MPIYLLSPIELNEHHDDWKCSSRRDPILIRAQTERRAREIASTMSVEATSDGSVHLSPWVNESLVAHARETNTGYPEDGKDEILEPKGLQEKYEQLISDITPRTSTTTKDHEDEWLV